MNLVLDTCALIFMAEDQLTPAAVRALGEAHANGKPALVSPVTAWEIGMLAARGRIRIVTDPVSWFRRASSQPGLSMSRLTDEVLIASSFLPGIPPRDPVDRIIIASARARGAAVMTRDRVILDFGVEGHVTTIAC